MKFARLEFAPLMLLLTANAACSGSENHSGVMTPQGGATAAAGGTESQGSTAPASGGGMQAGSTSVAAGGQSASVDGGAAAAAGSATVAADCRKEGDDKTTLVFVNHCAQAVEFRGSDITGGTLAPGAFACVDVGSATAAIDSKRYWGYAGSDPGAEHHSLAEFTFNSDFYDLDWYNISYVDAFNLPLAILPSARPKCRPLICKENFLSECPAEGQLRDGSGQLVSCVSPHRDDPSGAVVLLFERCDDAYAWSGDDQNGTDVSPMVGCQVEDFDIVFCP